MLKRCVLGIFENVRGNPRNLMSTNISGLRLFPSQFSKLVDWTDYCKSFFDVFHDISSYWCRNDVFYESLEIFEEITRILFLLTCQDWGSFTSQFSKLMDQTDCQKSFFDVFRDILSHRCRNDVFKESLETLEEIPRIWFLQTCQDCGSLRVNFRS